MNITLMHYSAPPIVGGVENVLAQHACLMANAGHRVQVVAARGEAWSDSVTLRHAPLIDSLHPEVLAVKSELDRGEVTPHFVALRDSIIAQIEPLLANSDVVIAHNICSLAKNLPLTAALAELQARSPQMHFILWHHDLAWTTPRYRAELHDGHPWDLLRSPWPGATHVVDSHLRRRELADLIGIALETIHVIPIGVDLTTFYKLDGLTADLLNRIDLWDAAPILLLPVRLTRRKNIEFGLHMLAALRQRMPQASLVVTGPVGPHNLTNVRYLEEIRTLRSELGLQNAAIFLADWSDQFLPDSVIADLYRLADALFLPSLEEGFGIPMLEAALSRMPIFCSAIEPLTELGRADVVYFDPVGDPGVAAAAVATTLECSPVYRAATHARRTHRWAQVYTEHIAPLLASLSLKKEAH